MHNDICISCIRVNVTHEYCIFFLFPLLFSPPLIYFFTPSLSPLFFSFSILPARPPASVHILSQPRKKNNRL